METTSKVLKFLDEIFQKRYEEEKKRKRPTSWRGRADNIGREYIVCSIAELPTYGQYKLYKMGFNSKDLPEGKLCNRGQGKAPLVPLPTDEGKYFVMSAKEYANLSEQERLQKSLNRGFPLIIEFEGYEVETTSKSKSYLLRKKDYIPIKEDVEFALSQLREQASSEEIITPEAVINKMEENFIKADKRVVDNWKDITMGIIKTEYSREQ